VLAWLEMLDKAPNALFVIPIGDNYSPTTTASQLTWGSSKAAHATILKYIDVEYQAYASRVITVAASRAGNHVASFSPWSRGKTDIVAPGQDIPILARSSGYITANGVSFAVPLVAGVAAQLLAMDFTLTPEQVRDYILRGARQPQEDPATGNITTPLPVQGAPAGEQVYDLDAHGSLRLLSNTRPFVPLCGVRLATGTLPSEQLVVTALRDSAPPEAIGSIQADGGLAKGTVARGGRLVATGGGGATIPTVTFNFNDAIESRLSSGQWVQSTVPGVNLRLYAEKDTIDVRHTYPDGIFERSRFEVRVRGQSPNNPSGWVPYGNPMNRLHFHGMRVNATGDWLHWSGEWYCNNPGCNSPPVGFFSEVGLARLRSTSPSVAVDSGFLSDFA
jgi:hypothetical protein